MKSQVTIDYSATPIKIDNIVISIQHDIKFNKVNFHKFIKTKIVDHVVKKYCLNKDFKLHINPAGSFTIGGPIGDTGLTGRKLMVDTYGGKAHHGGGAFSGKDYTKVDRSAAYAARWIAKNIVAAKLATEVEIQISYAIGLTKPTALNINCFGTETVNISKLKSAVEKTFNLTPLGIIKALDLKKPIYAPTATFGHFGRDKLNLPWERTNQVKALQKFVKH